MCGIAGLFNFSQSLPEAGLAECVVRRMTDSIAHRGPDAEGVWVDNRRRCILGHRRLSIIDTSDAGRQPMSGANGRWVISFNGEIYNFLEVRSLLQAKDVHLRGRTDTEVLLECIAQWGVEALPKLDGMFAFAAFDTLSGEMILARDAFGEKPLYYVELPGGGLAFASELQALEKLPNIDAEVSLDAMAEVLMFQYIGAPRTIYRSVKKLPPGHWMRLVAGQPPKIGRFFEFRPGATGFDSRPMAALADELEDILLRSIRRRLISDVPLGAFLSGGVDSSTVCALICKKLGLPLKTFSIGFRDAPESEHEAARLFAKHIGSDHHDQILSPDTSAFLSDIGRILDEPNGDSSCMPTYLLSEFARQQVTVSISGDGGDEMFAGYGRYFHTLEDERSATRSGNWHPGNAYYSDRILVSTEKYVEELFGGIPTGLGQHLARLRAELTEDNVPLFCRLRKTDMDNYMPGAVLPKVDRMSMQHSLEVRTPFLNIELARFSERLPLEALYRDGRGKLLLREIAYRYLPRELVDAPKKGFGIPMSRWGRDALLGVASHLLEHEGSRLRQALGAEAMSRFLTRQCSKDGFSTYQVWSLVMLESWLRHHPAKLEGIPHALRTDLGHVRPLATEFRRELWAWPISVNEYRVTEDVSDDLALEGATTVGELPATLLPLRLPRWGERPSIDDFRRLAGLNGAKLVFDSLGHSKRIDRIELEKFTALGVVEVDYLHPYSPSCDNIRVRIPLRRRTLFQRATAALRLRKHIVARLGLTKRIEFIKLALKGQLPHGKRLVIGPLPGVLCEPDQEMAQQFMLFEGLTQLPPIPASHLDIAENGAGRYSVWNKEMFFSPTRFRRLLTHSYRLVERTSDTEQLFQYVPILYEGTGLLDFSPNLKKWIDTGGEAQVSAPPARPGCVVVLTHALSPGGAERQWCYLACALKRQGFEVYFVVIDSIEGKDGHYRSLLESANVPLIQLESEPVPMQSGVNGYCYALKLAQLWGPQPFNEKLLRLLGLLTRLKPQALFTQLDNPNILASVAGILVRVPKVVLSFRNYNPSHFSYLKNDWHADYYRTVLRSSRVIPTGNSHAANIDYAEWLGVDPNTIAWVPNAIDDVDFQKPTSAELAHLRSELGVEEGTSVMLGVFRLSDEKQPDIFLEVCTQILASMPNLRVLIAGIGPLHESMLQRIEELGIANQVALIGRRNDVSALMRISTLLLLTSSREGMPNVLMEAQLHGLPVVCTRSGGVPDCVQDGVTGFIEDVGDVGALTQACLKLLSSPEQAKHMGRTGAAWMREFFSTSKMAERFLEIAQIQRPYAQHIDSDSLPGQLCPSADSTEHPPTST